MLLKASLDCHYSRQAPLPLPQCKHDHKPAGPRQQHTVGAGGQGAGGQGGGGQGAGGERECFYQSDSFIYEL